MRRSRRLWLIPGVATPPEALSALAREVDGEVLPGTPVAAPDGELFGWSSGAFEALRLASTAPGVRRVFLFEPPFRRDRHQRPEERRQFLAVIGWRLLGQRRRALSAFWELASAVRSGPPASRALPAAQRELLLAWRGPLLRRLFAATGRHLPVVTVPVRLAVGTRSPDAVHRAAEALAGQLVDARVDRLDGLDHLAPLTAPAAIARWLQSL